MKDRVFPCEAKLSRLQVCRLNWCDYEGIRLEAGTPITVLSKLQPYKCLGGKLRYAIDCEDAPPAPDHCGVWLTPADAIDFGD